MLAFGFAASLVAIALIIVSVLLIALVLLQKNRGSGLSGAFGGVGGHSAFGTKTGDFLTWVTVGLAAVFLLLNVVGNKVFRGDRSQPTASTSIEASADGDEEQAASEEDAESKDEANSEAPAQTPDQKPSEEAAPAAPAAPAGE